MGQQRYRLVSKDKEWIIEAPVQVIFYKELEKMRRNDERFHNQRIKVILQLTPDLVPMMTVLRSNYDLPKVAIICRYCLSSVNFPEGKVPVYWKHREGDSGAFWVCPICAKWEKEA